MDLKFSGFCLVPLLTVIALSGCTSRPDLAPVLTDEQRNSQYSLDTVVPGPNSFEIKAGADGRGIKGNADVPVSSHRFPEDARQRKDRDNSFIQKETMRPAIALEADSAAVTGADSVYSKSGPETQPEPPHKAPDQISRSIKPHSENKLMKDGTDRKVTAAHDNDDKSDKTSGIKSKDEKQAPAKASETVYNLNKKKKKSIASIDNKKILMLNFQWPLKGKVRKKFHQTEQKGIDITGKVGQTVRASEAGKVVYSGQGLIGFGNLLIIKHNDNYLSAYANNGDLIVREGQHVGKGQDIAKLGMAASKKAILHFEIRKNGKPVDPLSLLP